MSSIPQSRQKKTFSVEKMMRRTVASLIRDFQDNLNDVGFCSHLSSVVLNGDIPNIRQLLPETDDSSEPSRFKATYQIASILKRFRFRKDTYSDSELVKKSIDDFISTQKRVASVHLDDVSAFTNIVLDGAAAYIRKVLGSYSDEEHRRLCRFGRRASVGIPAREACEASRWELPISGSSEQISWFDAEMRHVDCVQEYWINQLDSDPNRSVYQETSSLKLTLVPKTFKALRSIMPNTTIGSYMSFGLGEMIRNRLKRVGCNISTQQMRHRYLAQSASVHGLHVTLDLSAASDSISVQLIQRLFPCDWVAILNQSRIGVVELPDGSLYKSNTFCTMGIGYTFPLQTLVFLALLTSIQAILYHRHDRRTISVYGDDMIYAVRMHSQVLTVFEELGFVVNVDKTFHEGHFRESCGGDYYHGVDVRPFQPRNDAACVGRRTYEAILYKYINGLLMRWSEYEVRTTLDYLLSEVVAVAGKAKVVPHDYPDESGIKCTTPGCWDFLSNANSAKVQHVGHGMFRFSYLTVKSDLRKESRHEPYYWISLRGPDLPDHDCFGRLHSQTLGHAVKGSPDVRRFSDETFDRINLACAERSPFIVKEDQPKRTFRSKMTGARVPRTSTYVTISHTGRYVRQSGLSSFWRP